jgi:hypothetical protein
MSTVAMQPVSCAEERACVMGVQQEWFTTAEAAVYLRTSVPALRMRVIRGTLVPDSKGHRGRSRQHMFRRSTLDAHYKAGGVP